ncbi:MAG TPA: TerC family protein, partial [Beijerinckiaceae bacterium]
MDFLTAEWLGKPVWMWVGFHILVFILLAFDLGVLQKKTKDLGVRESLYLSAFYVTLGLLFGGWVWTAISP